MAEQVVVRPLRRNVRFQLLWIGSTVGFLGIEAADVGYPLAVLALTGSPAAAGLFGMVQTLATLLAGLPAGEITDRFDRRRVLIAAEATRALAAATVAFALATHHLTVPHLLGVAAVLGAAGPFGATARMLLVRSVVAPEQLSTALIQEQVRNGVSQLAGPPLGGLLYGLRQLLPFVFSAVAFAVSMLCALVVRVPARPTAPPARTGNQGVLAGIRTIWRDPTLRAATLLVAALNTVGAPLTLITTVILQRQSVRPLLIGVALAGLAIGSLAGAALVKPLHRRCQPGWLLLGVVLVEAPMVACLGVPLGPWWLAAVLACGGLVIPAVEILVDVLIFRQVPDEQRGRVIAAVITLFGIGMPVGTALAGVLLEYLGGQATAFVLAGLLALCAGYAVSRRELRGSRWPVSPVVEEWDS
jgi:MFS family permease